MFQKLKLPKRVKDQVPKLISLGQRQRQSVFLIVFAGIGVFLLVQSFAAANTANLEAENGQVSGATVNPDGTASGGDYVLFGTAGGDGVYNNTDPRFIYSGTWTPSTGADKYQQDDMYSQTTGSEVSFTFTGTQVTVYGTKASHHGIAAVTIDNGTAVNADYYAVTRADNTQIFRSPTLGSGTHTIKIRVTGTKNAASSAFVITIDRLVIGNDTTPPPPPPPPTPPPPPPPANNGFRVGVSLTHDSVNIDGSAAAKQKVINMVLQHPMRMNLHILGFGVFGPQPNPGQYDWNSLDAQINFVRSTGSEPVITLCCAHWWMKGVSQSEEFTKIENAPLPQYYDEFAAMSAEIAKRYRDVTYFQVWNEMKGFYSGTLNRWDYESYTTMYNQVYDAVKAARPDAKLGGPYVVPYAWQNVSNGGKPSGLTGNWGEIDGRDLDVITYWLANKHGGEFVVVDMNTLHRDGTNPLPADDFAANDRFAALSTWIRSKTNLPIWWGEFYPRSNSNTTYYKDVVMDAFNKVKNADSDMVLLWDEGTNAGNPSGSPNLWNVNGDPFPLFNAIVNAGYN